MSNPKKVEVNEEVEDRSAFNCVACNGEGMIFDFPHVEGKICPECRGTGRV